MGDVNNAGCARRWPSPQLYMGLVEAPPNPRHTLPTTIKEADEDPLEKRRMVFQGPGSPLLLFWLQDCSCFNI